MLQRAQRRQQMWQRLDDGPDGFAATTETSAERGKPKESKTTTGASMEEDESVDDRDGGGA